MASAHFDKSGKAVMTDVSAKPATAREARAAGTVVLNEAAYASAKARDAKKGDAVAVAELAGVMAAKKTADLIPLCHPLALSSVHVSAAFDDARGAVTFHARVKTTGPTGVEMEALTAASVACLTLYDMLKSVDRSMRIERIVLLEKSGGASGDFKRRDE